MQPISVIYQYLVLKKSRQYKNDQNTFKNIRMMSKISIKQVKSKREEASHKSRVQNGRLREIKMDPFMRHFQNVSALFFILNQIFFILFVIVDSDLKKRLNE